VHIIPQANRWEASTNWTVAEVIFLISPNWFPFTRWDASLISLTLPLWFARNTHVQHSESNTFHLLQALVIVRLPLQFLWNYKRKKFTLNYIFPVGIFFIFLHCHFLRISFRWRHISLLRSFVIWVTLTWGNLLQYFTGFFSSGTPNFTTIHWNAHIFPIL
jgi:hypothetical protein